MRCSGPPAAATRHPTPAIDRLKQRPPPFFRLSKGERPARGQRQVRRAAGNPRHAGAQGVEPGTHAWLGHHGIEQWSEQVLQLGQGTLYPALYRLERQGLIRSSWEVTENNRRARYYSLTREGRKYFSDELASWRRMSRAINLVLEAT